MPDKTFEIAIRTTADPSGAQEIEGELNKLKEEAASTHGVATGNAFDDTANQASLRREILATEQATTAADAESLALEERRASIMAQRQILIDIELQKTQALAAGNVEGAAVLEADLELRRSALQLQTSAGLSEEESLVIARQRITAEAEIAAAMLAQSEGSLLAGVNIGRARQEATTLVRQLATGSVNMRTFGALAGALGPALGISAIAALVMGETIGAIGKKMDESRITAEKESLEFQKQTQQWQQMAASAQTFADVQKINEEIATKISAINEKSRQLPSEVGEGFFTTELNSLKLISNFFGSTFKTSTDQAIDSQGELADQIRMVGQVLEAVAQKNAEFAQGMKDLPVADQIAKWTDRLTEFQARQEQVRATSGETSGSYKTLQAEIDGATKAITGLNKEFDKTHAASQKIYEELQKINFDTFSAPQQLVILQGNLDKIKLSLHDIGIEAKSPLDAYAAAGLLTDKNRADAEDLARKWGILSTEQTKLAGEIDTASEKETAAAAKSAEHHREQIDAFNKEIAALQEKRKALVAELLTTTDPAKHAALQKEIDDLNLQLRIKQQIKTATDEAAAAGKKWTDAESKALETEITGPLQAKLKILQEMVGLGAKGAQEQIDKLTGAPPPPSINNPVTDAAGNTVNYSVTGPTVPPVKDAAFYRAQLAQNPDDSQSKTELIALLQQQTDAIKVVTTTAATAASTAVTGVGKDTADGLGKISQAATDTAAQITPLFDPVAKAISGDIPKAISTGLLELSQAAVGAITNLSDAFTREQRDMQTQIDQLWQQV
jgi:predicted  nucleic acid-binding Zn-ribbon protein